MDENVRTDTVRNLDWIKGFRRRDPPPVPPHRFLGNPVRNFGLLQYVELMRLFLNRGKPPQTES